MYINIGVKEIIIFIVFIICLFIQQNLTAQINCSTYKEVATSNDLSNIFNDRSKKSEDLWATPWLNIYVLNNDDIYLANIQSDFFQIEKYNSQLELIKSGANISFDPKYITNGSVVQLFDRLYFIYIENIGVGVDGTSKLYAQEINKVTLALEKSKFDILESEDNFDLSDYSQNNINGINSILYFEYSENKKFMSILIQYKLGPLKNSLFKYIIFEEDFQKLYEGVIETIYNVNDVKSVSSVVSDGGAFSMSITVQKKTSASRIPFRSAVLYFTSVNNNVKSFELDDQLGHAKSIESKIIADKVFVDVEWQLFDDSESIYEKKLFIYDVNTGREIKKISNMVFDYMPLDEAEQYGRKSKKTGYMGMSKEFSLQGIQMDIEGNYYLRYLDIVPYPVGTETAYLSNPQNVISAGMAFIKLDAKFEKLWGHMFYISNYYLSNLIFENNKVHAFGTINTFYFDLGLNYLKTNESAWEGTLIKDVQSAPVDDKKEVLYRFDINFNSEGDFEINNFSNGCDSEFDQYQWFTGGYYQSTKAFVYIAKSKDPTQSLKLIKFGY